jgi:hypothetical protein
LLRISAQIYNTQAQYEYLGQAIAQLLNWEVHQRIIARSEVVQAKTGIQQASTDLIRRLREGEERRD